MKLNIKKALSELEINDAMMIRKKVFIQEQDVPVELEVDEFEAVSKHFIAYLDKAPVATGRMREFDGYIKFERIASLKSMRGKGFGKKLMSYMQDYAEINYPKYKLKMHAQETAISFYTQIGWISIGEIFEEAGIKHQLMMYEPSRID